MSGSGRERIGPPDIGNAIMRHSILTAVLMATACWSSGLAAGGEPELTALVPGDSVLVVAVNRPLRVLDSSFLQEIGGILSESTGYQQSLATPEYKKLRQALQFIEHSQGTDWRTALGRLTAEGAILAVRVERVGGPAVVSVVLSADEESTLTRLVEAGMTEIKRQANAKKQADGQADKSGDAETEQSPIVSREYAGVMCYKVGNGFFAQTGRRLLLSSHKEGLQALVDRQQGRVSEPGFEIPAALRITDSRGNPPVVQAVANIRKFREGDENLQQALKLPANDVFAAVLLGGFFDLLRHSDSATAALVVEDQELVARIRFPTGSGQFTDALKGFFAIDGTAAAAPPLRIPGAFFTASWYRDYARLWQERHKLIPEAVVKQMEEGNAEQRSQTGGIGILDVVEMLGPHFRFVAAPQTESVYKTELKERIPAFGAAIDVRDEATFRERVFEPLNKIVNSPIVVVFAEVGSVQHRGATLTTIRFREDEKAAGKSNQQFYQYNPAFTLTHGHLVVGSTVEIARGIVEALDNQLAEPIAPSPAAPGVHVSSVQELSLRDVLAYGKEYEPRLLRGAILRNALAPDEARRDLDTLRRLLTRVGAVKSQTTIGENFFDVSLKIGERPNMPEKRAAPAAP
jgi:hypothetical protein